MHVYKRIIKLGLQKKSKSIEITSPNWRPTHIYKKINMGNNEYINTNYKLFHTNYNKKNIKSMLMKAHIASEI